MCRHEHSPSDFPICRKAKKNALPRYIESPRARKVTKGKGDLPRSKSKLRSKGKEKTQDGEVESGAESDVADFQERQKSDVVLKEFSQQLMMKEKQDEKAGADTEKQDEKEAGADAETKHASTSNVGGRDDLLPKAQKKYSEKKQVEHEKEKDSTEEKGKEKLSSEEESAVGSSCAEGEKGKGEGKEIEKGEEKGKGKAKEEEEEKRPKVFLEVWGEFIDLSPEQRNVVMQFVAARYPSSTHTPCPRATTAEVGAEGKEFKKYLQSERLTLAEMDEVIQAVRKAGNPAGGQGKGSSSYAPAGMPVTPRGSGGDGGQSSENEEKNNKFKRRKSVRERLRRNPSKEIGGKQGTSDGVPVFLPPGGRKYDSVRERGEEKKKRKGLFSINFMKKENKKASPGEAVYLPDVEENRRKSDPEANVVRVEEKKRGEEKDVNTDSRAEQNKKGKEEVEAVVGKPKLKEKGKGDEAEEKEEEEEDNTTKEKQSEKIIEDKESTSATEEEKPSAGETAENESEKEKVTENKNDQDLNGGGRASEGASEEPLPRKRKQTEAEILASFMSIVEH